LTVDGAKVTAVGTTLAMAENYVFGATASDSFYSFFGDTTGSRDVGVFDLLRFRQTYQLTSGEAGFDPRLDFSADGAVNPIDLLRFRQRFRRSIVFG